MRTKHFLAGCRRGAWLLALVGSALTGRADYVGLPNYSNPWYNTNGINGALTNLVPATTTCYGGNAGVYGLPGGFPTNPITDGTFTMASSSIGLPFAETTPNAAIGSMIIPPTGALTNTAPLGFFPTNGAYFSPTTGQLIAAEGGNLAVQWLMANGSTNTITYLVSGIPVRRPQRLYWTAAPYYAPVVSLNGKFAIIHYNDEIQPPIVTTNITTNIISGSVSTTNYVTNIVTDTSSAVWISDSGGNKSIQANGCNGMVVIEFFSSGSFQTSIGREVVQVQAPDIIFQTVNIGQRLLPMDKTYGAADLQAQVAAGQNSQGLSTLWLQNSSDGQSPMQGWLYSIYPTVEDPWDAEVWWMNPGVAGVFWPWEVDQYIANWPNDCQVMVCSTTNSAPVIIPASLNPQIMPAQNPPRNFSLQASTNSCDILTVQTNGYVLLQYSDQAEQVWFQVVRAVEHNDPLLYDLTPVPWTVATPLAPATVISTLLLGQQTWLDLGTTPTLPGRQPTSVALWAKVLTNTSVLFGGGETNQVVGSLYMAPVSISGSNITFTAGAYGFSTTNITLPGSLNAWHQYAITYDGFSLVIYYDSTSVATWTATLNVPSVPFYVGNKFAGPTNTAGPAFAQIANLQVWAEALTPEQLQAIMSRNLTVAELNSPDLLACYPFYENEDPGTALDFSSQGYEAAIWHPGGYVAGNPIVSNSGPWSSYPGYLYSGWSYNPNLYSYPVNTNGQTSLSTIIPIHTNSVLETWWANPYQPAGMSSPVYFPSLVVRYQPQWPTNAPTIVLANQTEQNSALPDYALNPALYYQNNTNQPGFNPNEEHALLAGNNLYAIRNDLNSGAPDSSAPLVLVQYTNANSGRPGMLAYNVVATNSQYGFNYSDVVPSMLIPPAPLDYLPNANCQFSTPSSGPAWRDSNTNWWAYRAGLDGVSPATIAMNWFYPSQPGFFYPGQYPQPAIGQQIPFLSGHGSQGAPMPVLYTVNWPSMVPVLNIADTLTQPNQQQMGLPDIAGQLSVNVLFQQSLPYAFSNVTYTTPSGAVVQGVYEYPTGNISNSVVLIDPTQIRPSPVVFTLPSTLQTQVQNGRTYFPALPPELNQRLWWQQTVTSSGAGQLFLLGQNVQPPAGVNYLLLNCLTPGELAATLALSTDANWQAAVNGLPTGPVVIAPNQPFDTLALSAGIGCGSGFVTMAFNSGSNVPPGNPISLACINVQPPLVTGAIEVITPVNPLSPQTTMRHSVDCAGQPQNYQFDWRYNWSTTSPGTDFTSWPVYGSSANQITFGQGQPLFTLQSTWFVCRYRALNPLNPAGTNNWSAWTQPMIAESWVQRAMNAINPYTQRLTDFQQYPPNYLVNMVAQAGAPYLGNVALNDATINDFGLIQIYSTIYDLTRSMIAAIPGGADQGMNDTLRYAVTRLNALYMLLGNEAYSDALDPTIAYNPDVLGDYAPRASSLFCFENQCANLLEEELALLRGRDDSLPPGVQNAPFFNRLIWNFTSAVDGGEMAYALNYGMPDAQGNFGGTISAASAETLYPQGHGDAWGHYLSGLGLYYELLHTSNYVWNVDNEEMNVGGVTVQVDYYDEEKFAESAAAMARTGLDIARRTFQKTYYSDPQGVWKGYRDTENTNRCWATGDWTVRAGQRAYFDWLTVNSLIPCVDTNTSHTGIQVIDRGTVLALDHLAATAGSLQNLINGADGRLNPLGLARNVMPFDISPAGIDAGQTHFEQIYSRALVALNNAKTALDNSQGASQRLRHEAADVNQYVHTVVTSEEAAANSRLLQILGMPYPEDIGVGQLYPQGYTGPDYIHYMYVDLSPLGYDSASFTNQVVVSIPQMPTETWNIGKATDNMGLQTTNLTFYLNSSGVIGAPPSYTSQRTRQGEWQAAQYDYLSAQLKQSSSLVNLQNQLNDIQSAVGNWNSSAKLDVALMTYDAAKFAAVTAAGVAGAYAQYKGAGALNTMNTELLRGTLRELTFGQRAGAGGGVIAGMADGEITILPTDPGQVDRESANVAAQAKADAQIPVVTTMQRLVAASQKVINMANHDYQAVESFWGLNTSLVHQFDNIKSLVAGLTPLINSVRQDGVAVDAAMAQLQSLTTEAEQILAARTQSRSAGAWRVQSARYADMTMRVFRDEALRQYSESFNLAGRYAYLAACAYDYETSLLTGDPTATSGTQFMDSIMRTRSLGSMANGQPLVGGTYGDSGLADALARMKADYDVLKGRLGFNNPQTEVSRMSLRTELYRTAPDAASDPTWQNTLQLAWVDLTTIPEYNQYCKPFTPGSTNEPGLAIQFSSTIMPGQNFFGQDLAGGDNAYDPTHVATKIRSVGIWFSGYTNTFGVGLANAPYVYLVPVGTDRMRTATRDSGEIVRNWNVFDQALPVPYNISSADLNQPSYIPYFDSLSENFGARRRFAALRAYHDSGNFSTSELSTDARLIGRSVWNTKWLLLIPGRSLLNDPNEGLNRFIYGPLVSGSTTQRTMQGVTDIKLFFNTYSLAGD